MSLAISAQFAQAACANLSGGMASPVLADALQAPQGAFTLTHATLFASNQSVLLQYNDDAAVAGSTGRSLSLTVFQATMASSPWQPGAPWKVGTLLPPTACWQPRESGTTR